MPTINPSTPTNRIKAVPFGPSEEVKRAGVLFVRAVGNKLFLMQERPRAKPRVLVQLTPGSAADLALELIRQAQAALPHDYALTVASRNVNVL